MADIENTRRADHAIDRIFTERWSPRAFTGEEIPVETLMSFFEAARWSPSAYNSQPWRFIWARRGTPHFDKLLGCLTGRNPDWSKLASALVMIASSKTMKVPNQEAPIPSHSHSFDAGSAWMAFALQASMSGWFTHGMVGVDWEKATVDLNVPDGFRLEAAVAVGRLGDKSTLPEFYQTIEAPNARRPVTETAFEGSFPSA